MSLMSHFPTINGQYDDNGIWEQKKHCFVFCGASCDCGPPMGQYYSAAHDKRPESEKGKPSGILALMRNHQAEQAAAAAVCPWDSWKSERTIA